MIWYNEITLNVYEFELVNLNVYGLHLVNFMIVSHLFISNFMQFN